MGDRHQKGSFKTEIPPEVMEDAVRSVERNTAPAEDEVPVEVIPDVEEGAQAAAPDAAEVASLRAQLALSQEKSRETMERLKETHERLLRAAADLENYRKRAQREKDEVQKFGVEKLVKDLLPVLDNLDRALAAAPADDPLTAGVSLVRSTFEQALAKYGVKGFSAMGEPFDPARHEALMQVATAEQPPGTVVLEHARGFTMHDRLVRPALVGVSTLPAGGAGGDGGASN